MKRKLYVDYIVIQGLFFILMGIFCGYGSYILLSFGYSSSSTGIIMAIGSLLSAILQSICANVSDNSKKLSLFKVCCLLATFCIIFIIASYVQSQVNLLASIIFILTFGTYATFEPLINSIPGLIENAGYKISYGVGRAMGSAGYAIANIILSFLSTRFDYHISLLLAIIVAIILLILFLKTNKDFENIPKPSIQIKQENISYKDFLKNHKSFLILCIFCAFIFLGFTMSDNMMILVVTNCGGNQKDLGFIMAIKAFLEIPVIFFFDKISNKINESKLIIISGFVFLLKALLYYLANNIATIYLAQLTSTCSLALYIPAMVSYINKIMSPKEAVRGQALEVSFLTLASLISAYLAGKINELYDTKTMLLISVIFVFIGAISNFFILRKDQNK